MPSLDIGSTPGDEQCAQVGSKQYDYYDICRIECRAYIVALKKHYGEPPEGAELFVKRNPHDYGAYYDVHCRYDETQEALDYALKVENGLRYWEDANMRAPITYDDHGNTALILKDPIAWDVEKTPSLVEYLAQQDALAAQQAAQDGSQAQPPA